MDYYNILNFKKEPFSNSPEPEFLFQLPQYSDCLQKLELAVRLRRGINVVIGDIGTGKTTLCRKLIQTFSSSSSEPQETEIETHLLLDPAFDNAAEFLRTVSLMLGIRDADDLTMSEWHLKERIKNYLFDRGVNEKKIVVLLIDEGQKIPENCLEILREFLNFETNEVKLLQIIIFAQKEFQKILERKANLYDRVNLIFHLRPLSFRQTKAMINYRLDVARNFENVPSLFTLWGFIAVYLATGGYPRKIVFLCHQVILKMIIRGKDRAGWFLVNHCKREMRSPLFRRTQWAMALLVLVMVMGFSFSQIDLGKIHIRPDKKNGRNDAVTTFVSPRSHPETLQDVKMPEYLGKISMTPKRTLWWTLHNIYGDTSPQMMEEIRNINPQLGNNDKVTVGTAITLKSIPVRHPSIKQGDIVVALESGQDLGKMYNIFRNQPNESALPPCAFFSSWNKKKGFEFSVVINKKFKDIQSAKEAIAKLPQDFAARAQIISPGDEGTVFFNRQEMKY